MAAPSSAITRHDLSMPFMEFDLEMNQRGYIGASVFKPVSVGLQSANMTKITLENVLQSRTSPRAPGTGYQRNDFEFTTYNYSTQEYGLEEPMDDRTVKIYSDLIDAEAIHSARAIDGVLQQFERAIETAVYNTGSWTGALTTAITNEWDDHTNATPIDDIGTAAEAIFIRTGVRPNALILNSWQLWNLMQCSQILDRIKYAAEATQQHVANVIAMVMGIDRFIVSGGIKNTANPLAAASLSRLWSNEYMMLARVAESNDPQEVCIGRSYMWSEENNGLGGDGAIAVVSEEYREETVRGSVFRARADWGTVTLYADCGQLFSNAIT
jgi:hypothetical protein